MNRIYEAIVSHKLIVIIRGLPETELLKTAEALYKGGIRLVEVTFNQKSRDCVNDTAKAIRALCGEFSDMHIGAGTVMNEEQANAAVDAGAGYLISPDANEKVIKAAKDGGVLSIPGAMTPTEIAAAYNAGADFVKLFPAGELGVGDVKAGRSPLNNIPLLAVGGIDHKNMPPFLDAGILGFGVGGNIVKPELITDKRFDGITELAQLYVSTLNRHMTV